MSFSTFFSQHHFPPTGPPSAQAHRILGSTLEFLDSNNVIGGILLANPRELLPSKRREILARTGVVRVIFVRQRHSERGP